MRFIILILIVFPSLLVVCNAIYAISHSKTMAIINLIVLGIFVILGAYLFWIELFPKEVKKDKIIKDYSPE